MARKKDYEWSCGPEGSTFVDQAQLAVLMDIRDELKRLNATLDCHRFHGIPTVLGRIDRRLQANGILVNPKRKKA